MITESPDPAEVADFHFLQLRTLKIDKESKNVSGIQGNILASASKYGLLFAGTEGGFKVIKLETLLTIDEDKENRSAVESYESQFVPSGTPVVLALNASQTILAVCVKCSTNVVINLYNLSNYSGSGKAWQPFCTNALSPSKAEVRDFLWNPAVEGWYAVCFSDGSLQIHEVAGMSVKVIGSLQGAGATAVCWSPKGKQLVVGKENGSFAQYKPNLTEVKSIPPPAFEESPVSIASICWTANTVFAVLYVLGDNMPSLFIVSTPKDSAVSYTNYYDVCLGNNCAPFQKYLIHFEPSWGMMVCASLDSIEIAVLGNMPNWVQWDIKEDGKALLPIKDGATHAAGITVMYSAQRQLVISESESYPPMPVLLVLTNNGLLVSFHMINSNSAAPSLVCAPVALENSAAIGDTGAGPSSSASINKPLISTTFSVGAPAASDPSASQSSKAPLNLSTAQTFSKAEVPAAMSVVEQRRQISLFGEGIQKRPEDFTFNQVQKPTLNTQALPTPLHSGVEKQTEVQSNTQNSYMAAIISEIQSFEKELQDLKQLQNSTPSFDGEEEMLSLKNSLNKLDFQKNISEKMKNLNQDIHSQKNVLLESFMNVEEGISRERRRNDHSYITMLKERALDPITAKRMHNINMLYQYLNIQIPELSDKLDQDWVSLCTNRKKSLKNNFGNLSSEAIYKTIVNNINTIYNLRKTVEILMKKTEERKLRNTSKSGSWGRYHKRSTQEDLSKLADEFLEVKIANPDECEPTVTKKLSSKSQGLIKEYLKQSNIVTVRPTAVYSPSQSRLLSHTIPTEELEHSQDQDITPKIVSVVSSNAKEVPLVIASSSEIQTPASTPKVSLIFDKTPIQSTSKGPIYEPITPPEVVKPIVKTIPVNNTHESSVLKEKTPDRLLFKGIGSGDSSISNSPDPSQVSSLNILSNIKGNVSNPPNVSSSAGGPLAFNQTMFEKVPSTSASLYPNTLSFLQNTQKAPETVLPKPQVVSSSTPVSSAAPSIQFAAGPKKEISFSIASITSSTTSAPKASSTLSERAAPEGQESPKQTAFAPLQNKQPLSTNILNQPTSQNLGFGLPATKSLPASSLSFFSVPENKTVFQLPGNKDAAAKHLLETKQSLEAANASVAKSGVGMTFKALSDVASKPEVSIPKKDATPETTATAQISVLNLTSSKTDPAGEKSYPSLAPTSQTGDSGSTVPALSSSNPTILTSVTTSNAIQKPDVLVISSSQPSPLSTFSGFTHSLSSPDTPTSVPAVVSTTAVSTAAILPPVSESTQSTAQVLASSADATKSTSSPLTTVAPAHPAVSKTSFFAVPQVFSPITTTAPPPPPPVTTALPAAPVFGLGATVTTAANTSTTTTDVTATKAESAPIFGAKAAPAFEQASSEKPSFFGNTSIFGQTATTQPSASFGQAAPNASFPAAGGGFFSQVPGFGTAAAASPAPAVTTSSTDFSNQASTFSFGKPAFGQTTGSSFGLAKTFFGQNTTPSTQPASPSSFSFGQSSPNVGGFFSGLGGKPSEENASKNVFGLSTAKPNTDASNLFRNSSVTSFGAVNSGSFSTSPGSFSSGGGSVAQAGFGSFQQTSSPPQSGGFGTSPSFGGAPAFGSPPAFGGAPAFGSGNALASVFGQQQQQQQQQQVSSNFSNFANSSSPTFGSLASQSPPSFGNSGGFGSTQGSGFGSPQGSGFGSPFGGSSFGQPSGFGSPGSPPSNSSAFTQWRS